MTCRRRLRLALGTGLTLLAAAGSSAADEKVPRAPIPKPAPPPPPAPVPRAPPALQLEIEAPTPNQVIGAEDGKLMVSGRALAASARGGIFDVIAIVDTSSSTSSPAGADIDGDGFLGTSPFPLVGKLLSLPSTDRGDSVLAAEIAAVGTLLQQLDPAYTRVGVVAFAGDSRKDTPDAKVVAPLTSDYTQVEAALEWLKQRGPRGRTNIQEAVLTASRELVNGEGAVSPARKARKIALLMTDGYATLPDTSSRLRSARLAIRAAGLAAQSGIRIDTFAVGHSATNNPKVTAEVARVTRGEATTVVNPADLVAAFQEVRLVDIRGVQINNLTTRRPAEQVRVESDGWFGGIVGLVPGRNRIEIRAMASDGRRIIRVVDARLVAGADPQPMDPRLMARRTRMLQTRLDQTRQQTLELEAEKRERLRDELEREMNEKRSQHDRNIEIEGEREIEDGASSAAPSDD
jgi:hypothetical protein